MKEVLLFIFLSNIFYSCTQNYVIIKDELKSIVKDISDEDLTDTRRYVIDSFLNFDKKSIVKQDTVYSIATCDQLDAKWSNEIFDNAKIVSQKYLDSVVNTDQSGLDSEHYGLSMPYFSKDKQSFIIYYYYYCGYLCEEYSLRLYRKINEKWVFVRFLSRSVS